MSFKFVQIWKFFKTDTLQFLKILRSVKEFEVLTNREDHQVLKELYSKDLKLVKEL